jgi:zinc finger protein 830
MLSKVKKVFLIVAIFSFLHREYRQRVDMLKKQLVDSKAARTAKVNSKPVGMDMESSSDSSSEEEDDNTDFAVDWRAQHLK